MTSAHELNLLRAAAWRGGAAERGVFFDAAYPVLRAKAAAILRTDAVDDVVQLAAEKLHKAIGKGACEGECDSWLFTIVQNVVRDEAGRAKRQAELDASALRDASASAPDASVAEESVAQTLDAQRAHEQRATAAKRARAQDDVILAAMPIVPIVSLSTKEMRAALAARQRSHVHAVLHEIVHGRAQASDAGHILARVELVFGRAEIDKRMEALGEAHSRDPSKWLLGGSGVFDRLAAAPRRGRPYYDAIRAALRALGLKPPRDIAQALTRARDAYLKPPRRKRAQRRT